jgi:hypothetical protein
MTFRGDLYRGHRPGILPNCQGAEEGVHELVPQGESPEDQVSFVDFLPVQARLRIVPSGQEFGPAIRQVLDRLCLFGSVSGRPRGELNERQDD